MPYYVYAIKGFGLLEKLAEYPTFREASARAKALRRSAPDPASATVVRIKLIFGADDQAAEDALLQVREAGHVGDE